MSVFRLHVKCKGFAWSLVEFISAGPGCNFRSRAGYGTRSQRLYLSLSKSQLVKGESATWRQRNRGNMSQLTHASRTKALLSRSNGRVLYCCEDGINPFADLHAPALHS